MNIFISWSGRRGLLVAKRLAELLPLILHGCVVWLSTENIRRGAQWRAEIERALSRFSACIVCVTLETPASPWVNFEIGALSKSPKKSRFICTYNIDGSTLDPSSPLGMFQSTRATREETEVMLRHLNAAMKKPVPEAQLMKLFSAFWPELARAIHEARRRPRVTRAPAASARNRVQKV